MSNLIKKMDTIRKLEIKNIDINKLRISKFNVRKLQNNNNEKDLIKNLKENIDEKGLLNPLTVKYNFNNDTFDIIAGQRRFMALKQLKYKLVACNVVDDSLSEKELLVLSFTENMQRKKMSLSNIVKACGKIKHKYKYDNKKISNILNINENIVNKYLSITHLPESILNRLDKTRSEKISLNTAYLLGKLNIENDEDYEKLIQFLDDVNNEIKQKIIRIMINQGKYSGYDFDEYLQVIGGIKKNVVKDIAIKKEKQNAFEQIYEDNNKLKKTNKSNIQKRIHKSNIQKRINKLITQKHIPMYIKTKTRNPQLQKLYREGIINRYKKCIITGMSINVCEAAHIIPFSESDKDNNFNIDNGLLLNATLHKLFDKYHLSINPITLCVEINKKSEDYEHIKSYNNHHINILKEYKDTITKLKYHYDIYKKILNK